MQAVSGSERIADEKLMELSELEIFDKDRLKTLIEKVIVYGENDMKIVWRARSSFGSEFFMKYNSNLGKEVVKYEP